MHLFVIFQVYEQMDSDIENTKIELQMHKQNNQVMDEATGKEEKEKEEGVAHEKKKENVEQTGEEEETRWRGDKFNEFLARLEKSHKEVLEKRIDAFSELLTMQKALLQKVSECGK
jgi:hypothetical protein